VKTQKEICHSVYSLPIDVFFGLDSWLCHIKDLLYKYIYERHLWWGFLVSWESEVKFMILWFKGQVHDCVIQRSSSRLQWRQASLVGHNLFVILLFIYFNFFSLFQLCFCFCKVVCCYYSLLFLRISSVSYSYWCTTLPNDQKFIQ